MTTRKVVGQGTKKCSKGASGSRITNKEKRKTLKRDTLTISASEVNRFTYCQYQWYYERLYGRTELGKRYRGRNQQPNQQPNLKNTAERNFSRGRAYHKNEYLRYRLKHTRTKALILTLILMFILVAIYLWVRMG